MGTASRRGPSAPHSHRHHLRPGRRRLHRRHHVTMGNRWRLVTNVARVFGYLAMGAVLGLMVGVMLLGLAVGVAQAAFGVDTFTDRSLLAAIMMFLIAMVWGALLALWIVGDRLWKLNE